MTRYFFYIINRVASISLGVIVGLVGIVLTLNIQAVSSLELSFWYNAVGPVIVVIGAVSSKFISRKIVSTDVYIQQPGNPGTQQGTREKYRIVNESERLVAEATIPEWMSEAEICFEEHDGYGVNLSGYPKGVERTEGGNRLKIDEGVKEFEFIINIFRETDHGATYTMKITNKRYNERIKVVEVELCSLNP